MNLYGIYKRNTIDNVPEMNALLDDTRDYCHMCRRSRLYE